jgi:hypothetical protein
MGTDVKCVIQEFDLRFGMTKEEVGKKVKLNEDNELTGDDLKRLGADKVILFFEHTGRLWLLKSYYNIADEAVAEALVERMSTDHRFQTPTSRISFDVTNLEGSKDGKVLYVRYTEINMKREYIHHQIALGRATQEEEDRARSDKLVKQMEEEEDIPTGPLIF